MPIRARDLGLPFPGTPGPLNAITDLPGVSVGFCTLTDPSRDMRTGVTAILPRDDRGQPLPVWAGFHALNGNGEMTGTHWIHDAGYMIGPICITNTHGIGAVHHGATQWMMRRYAEYFRGEHAWAMPVVGETYDGILNDITALHVTPDHAIAALDAAKGGPVVEGSTGGGNGMICYSFKGGTGTASRLVTIGEKTWTVGVLLQANFGRRPWLNILGKPVGELIPEGEFNRKDLGSVIVVVGTDAPLSAVSLRHVARRAGMGIARTGTPGGNSSGDLFLAFSTANAIPMPEVSGPILTKEELNPEHIDPLYLGVVEAVEEAVVNAMVAGEDVPTVKPRGRVIPALDHDRLRAIFEA